MKNVVLTSLISLLLIAGFNGFSQECKKDKKKKCKYHPQCSKTTMQTKLDTVSYIIGVDMGKNFKTNFFDVTPETMMQGIKDGIAGNDSVIKDTIKQKIMMSFQKEIMAKIEAEKKKQSEKGKAEGIAFLENNKKDPTVVVTASGLQYKVIKEGTGETPKATDKVTVHYEGKLINGKIFDSSYNRGEPASFPLNGVIPGWTEALQVMKPGAIYELFIPSELAYGEAGSRDIPGNAVLIFKVELIKVEAPKADAPKEKN